MPCCIGAVNKTGVSGAVLKLILWDPLIKSNRCNLSFAAIGLSIIRPQTLIDIIPLEQQPALGA